MTFHIDFHVSFRQFSVIFSVEQIMKFSVILVTEIYSPLVQVSVYRIESQVITNA